jgi:hypothetical protein
MGVEVRGALLYVPGARTRICDCGIAASDEDDVRGGGRGITGGWAADLGLERSGLGFWVGEARAGLRPIGARWAMGDGGRLRAGTRCGRGERVPPGRIGQIGLGPRLSGLGTGTVLRCLCRRHDDEWKSGRGGTLPGDRTGLAGSDLGTRATGIKMAMGGASDAAALPRCRLRAWADGYRWRCRVDEIMRCATPLPCLALPGLPKSDAALSRGWWRPRSRACSTARGPPARDRRWRLNDGSPARANRRTDDGRGGRRDLPVPYLPRRGCCWGNGGAAVSPAPGDIMMATALSKGGRGKKGEAGRRRRPTRRRPEGSITSAYSWQRPSGWPGPWPSPFIARRLAGPRPPSPPPPPPLSPPSSPLSLSSSPPSPAFAFSLSPPRTTASEPPRPPTRAEPARCALDRRRKFSVRARASGPPRSPRSPFFVLRPPAPSATAAP